MGLHARAWDGVTILVFGHKPLVAMQIEQVLAQASPGNEVKIDSFEHYGDALAHCRDRRDVGVFLISDYCGDVTAEDVFKNLAAPYETATGWSAVGALFFDKVQRTEGFKAMVAQRRIADYLCVDLLLNPRAAAIQLDRLWSEFCARMEESLFHSSLATMLRAQAVVEGLTEESQAFRNRAMRHLAQNLNVSWIDMLALEWVHVMQRLEHASDPKIVRAAERQFRIARIASFDESQLIGFGEIAQAKVPLASRLAHTCAVLDAQRIAGNLTQSLEILADSIKPGAPALLRVLAKSRHSIAEIAGESSMLSSRPSSVGKAS